MTDRSVVVRLRLNIRDFQQGTAEAAVESRVLRHELEGVDGRLGSVEKSADGAGKQIDKLSGRIAILTKLAFGVGPALFPLAAGAVPLFAGLTSELGAAAGGVGVLILGFHGLDKAFKALNDYELNRTPENLAKVREEFQKLGPEGIHFVKFLDEVQAQLGSLQRIARDGMFPGMEEGIDSALTLLPKVKSIIRDIAGTIGDLSADAGVELAGPEWRAFFKYLKSDAGPTLDQFARTMGNFITGFANMLAAFAPVSRDFSSGLLDMSRSFKDWSLGLKHDDGFQHFLDYITQQGPRALDFLGALINVLIQMAQAAAPIGEVILPLLTGLLDTISALAGSPLGPVFFTAAAAMSAYSGALSIAGKMQTRFTTGQLGMFTTNARTAAGVRGLAADLALLARNTLTAGAASERMQAMNAAATGRIKAQGAAALKTGAMLAGATIVATGAADQFGLTNTATLAMLGTMIEPGLGTAIGAGVGALLDWRDAAKQDAEQAEELQKKISELVNTGDLLSLYKMSEDAKKAQEAFKGTMFEDDMAAKLAPAADAFQNMSDTLNDFREVAGYPFPTDNVAELKDTYTTLQPILEQSGMTMEWLMRLPPGLRKAMVGAMTGIAASADTTQGRVQSVAAAMRDLSDEMKPVETRAESLRAALDNLIDPQMDLSAANDAWTTGLRQLDSELAKHNKAVLGNSNAAIKNRDAIRGRIDLLKEQLVAEAAAGKSTGAVMRTFRQHRQALIDTAVAAGVDRDAMVALLKQYNLTPKAIRTEIKVETQNALDKLKGVRAELAQLTDKTIHVDVVRTEHTGVDFISGAGTSSQPRHHAHGGTVMGAPFPYGDKVLTWLAPREQVISNEHGEADRYRADVAAGRNPAYDHWSPVRWDHHRAGGGTRTLERIIEHRVPAGPMRATIEGVGDAIIRIASDTADDRIAEDKLRQYEQARG